MESITVGGITYHFPYIEEVRPLNAQELALLTDGIKERGKVDVPIMVDEQNNVIDGHNRLRIAHDLDLPAVPREVLTGLTEEQKRERAAALNEERRQLTQEEIRERAAARRKQVQTLREAGMSERAIAKQVGVSHIQVHNDLQRSTVNPLTVERADSAGGVTLKQQVLEW